MKKKICASVIAALMIVLLCCGCGTENGNPASGITVTDHAGRTVTIEETPETIISGYYIATSMLIGLDQGDKLVGVENEAEKRPIYALSEPGVLDLPAMGTVKEFDLEACAAINPDLVVLPYKLKDMTTAIEELGISVMIVKPESPELLKETITMLGQATGSAERAEQLNQFIDSHREAVAAAVEGEDAPKVYLSSNSDFLFSACPAMYQHSLIEGAGGINVGQDIEDTYWSEVSYEQILTWDPDFIILAADAKYTVDDVMADPQLKECTAVKKAQVFKMPSEIECWDAPVPASVLGISWLASVLHPDAYDTALHEEAVDTYYETFYGLTK